MKLLTFYKTLTLLWVCLFFTGCSKPYSYFRICDFACLDDKAYFLVTHVEGIDKSSTFAHSVSLERTRVRVAIIQLPTSDKGSVAPELIGSWELKKDDFGNEGSLLLAGTNSCIFSTNPLRFLEFENHVARETDLGFGASKARMTTGRSFIVGCGSPLPWVVNTHSKMIVGGTIASNIGAIACPELGQSAIKRVSISEDIKTIAVHDVRRNPSLLRVYSFGDSTLTNELSVSEVASRLESVHQNGNKTTFLFESLTPLNQEESFLLDSTGKEIARRRVLGKIAANAQCTKIISLSEAQILQLNPHDDLLVQIWNPFEDRDLQLRLNLQATLNPLM